MPRHSLRTALAATLFCALLPACSSQPAAAPGPEVERLRARVERLEQESATERARLSADIAALRQSLDEAARNLAAADPQGARPDAPGTAEKSPRQALRDSLRSMVEGSRAALERLNRELDRQLEKHSGRPAEKPKGTQPDSFKDRPGEKAPGNPANPASPANPAPVTDPRAI